jgi:hypothetical protein
MIPSEHSLANGKIGTLSLSRKVWLQTGMHIEVAKGSNQVIISKDFVQQPKCTKQAHREGGTFCLLSTLIALCSA